MKDNYQVIKLTSGENIICDLKESDNNYLLQVKSPLKMEIVNRVTKSGMVEALALTRWVQPFTEQESIMINKSTVVTMVPASSGMSKYYEYVLKKMDLGDGPSEEELKAIEEEEKQGVNKEINFLQDMISNMLLSDKLSTPYIEDLDKKMILLNDAREQDQEPHILYVFCT